MNLDKERYENIKAPANADIIIEQAITKGQRHFKIRRSIASVLVLILVCTGILGSGFVSPVMANVLVKIPVVGSIFEKSHDKGLNNISEKGMVNFQDMQVTSEGITIAVKEVYYDKSGISVGYVVSGEGAGDKQFLFTLYCDGNMIPGGGSADTNNISKDLYTGIVTTVPEGQLPDSFELRIVFSESLAEKSPYDFSIPVSRREADPESSELTIMKYGSINDRNLLVKKVLFTPSSTTLDMEYTRPQGAKDFSLQLMNQDGKETALKSTGGDIIVNGKHVTDKIIAIFEPFDKIPEKLKLRVLDHKGKAVMEMEFGVK